MMQSEYTEVNEWTNSEMEEAKQVVVPKKKKPLKKNPLTKMPSRRERRAQARKEKTVFQPFYNNDEGVQTYEEFHGVGYERFNSKHILIKKVEKAEETE